MAQSTLMFSPVTEGQYAQLRALAEAHGISIVGYEGATEARGCTVGYCYHLAEKQLELTLLKAPPFCGGIAVGKLHDLVEQVLRPAATGPAAPAGDKP